MSNLYDAALSDLRRALDQRDRAREEAPALKELLAMKRQVSKQQRWRFVCDSDGHSYLIKTEDYNRFSKAKDEEDHDTINDEFEQYRCGGPLGMYSFVDPREEES